MQDHSEPGCSGRILIVDDDPVVAGMLGVSLLAAGHEIVEAGSGEEALARLAGAERGQLPDMVFLDIEMGMGIDGFETCRRLRAAQATCELPVIFLSGHDGLDDRLRAYDAGGSDFMAKPFVTDEVLRKARLAIAHRRRQETAAAQMQSSSATAMTALTSLGDSEVTLKFSRGALGCRSLAAMALLSIDSMAAFGLNCHVQLRTPGATLTLTPQGPASPLEESVIERSKAMGRIFSFGKRLIVNYDSVSLLVTNMPLADESLCGRIRDQAATIAETAELAVGNIALRSEAVARAEELRALAGVSRAAVEELRGSYRQLQVATCLELETMAHSIESLYVHLGLSNRQEFTISDTVRSAVDRVLTLFESSAALDSNFASIVEGLTRAGEYSVSQEDEAPLKVELW
ncbi:MAG: response regulator [Betaproteobacteria bacterium]|nr:response regulator [Rhodocyclales bacterium]